MGNHQLTGCQKVVGLRCGLVSDLHLEQIIFYQHQRRPFYRANKSLVEGLLHVPPPSQKLDVLFMAGDICELVRMDLWHQLLDVVTSYATYVVICAGNHEVWRTRFQKMGEFVSLIENGYPNVKFLENESVSIHGLEIHGTTLWTDFGFNDAVIAEVTDRYSAILFDRNVQMIRWQERGFRNIRGRDIQGLSVKARAGIEAWLEHTRSAKARVLLTHYPPFSDKVPRWGGAYPKRDAEFRKGLELIECTEMSEVIGAHPDVVCLHGHLHGVNSYRASVGNKVYSNPRGITDLEKGARSSYSILEFEL